MPWLVLGAVILFLLSSKKSPSPSANKLGGSQLTPIANTAQQLAQGYLPKNLLGFLPQKTGTVASSAQQTQQNEQLDGAIAGATKGVLLAMPGLFKDLGTDTTGKNTDLSPQAYQDQAAAMLKMQQDAYKQMAMYSPQGGNSSLAVDAGTQNATTGSDLGIDGAATSTPYQNTLAPGQVVGAAGTQADGIPTDVIASPGMTDPSVGLSPPVADSLPPDTGEAVALDPSNTFTPDAMPATQEALFP